MTNSAQAAAPVTPHAAQPTVEKTALGADPIKSPEGVVTTEKPMGEKEAPKEVQAEVTFDLKLPEGSFLDAAHIEKVIAFAKSKGLSNEQAQEQLNKDAETVKAESHKAQMAQIEKNKTEWFKLAEGDKEIGGAVFKENAELAKRVVHKFATEPFIKALDETGLGNHPELIRVFARIGKEMGEDRLVIPSAQTSGKKSVAEIFYPNMGKTN